LRFGNVGNSVKSPRWDRSFIDIEIDQPINQQERPFLVMELVEARPGAGELGVSRSPAFGGEAIQRGNFKGVRRWLRTAIL
jgi:hypothetical protein